MKRKSRVDAFAVIALCFLLPLISTYMDYYVLIEVDFLSEQPKFESPDLEPLLLVNKQELARSGDFPGAVSVATDLPLHFSSLNCHVTPQDKTPVLRC